KEDGAKKRAAAVLKQFQARGVPLDRMHVVTAAGADAGGIGGEERSDADPNAPMARPAGMGVPPRQPRSPAAADTSRVGMAPATQPATQPETPPATQPAVSYDDNQPSLAVVPPTADADGDGVADADDKCPNDKETVNGYMDDDGCPDAVPKALKKF